MNSPTHRRVLLIRVGKSGCWVVSVVVVVIGGREEGRKERRDGHTMIVGQ